MVSQTHLCQGVFSAISEAIDQSCSTKNMLFNILKNPQENTPSESIFNKVVDLQ